MVLVLGLDILQEQLVWHGELYAIAAIYRLTKTPWTLDARRHATDGWMVLCKVWHYKCGTPNMYTGTGTLEYDRYTCTYAWTSKRVQCTQCTGTYMHVHTRARTIEIVQYYNIAIGAPLHPALWQNINIILLLSPVHTHKEDHFPFSHFRILKQNSIPT